MLTEAEAREKWCPMVRLAEATAPPGYPSRNRGTMDEGVHPLCRCIASNCMAWRWWVDERSPNERCEAETGLTSSQWIKKYQAEYPSAPIHEAWAGFNQLYLNPLKKTHGYCGAFGKPGEG